MTGTRASSSKRISLTSSSSKPRTAGILIQKDGNGKKVTARRVNVGSEVIIGRDHTRCQHVIDDPHVSRKHLRIYTIVYDNDDPSEVDALIYAEDLSSHGTYWNGSLIGRGNGGFLLSDGDVLKLAPNVSFQFQSLTTDAGNEAFDIVQEHEMQSFYPSYILTDRLLGAGAFGRVFMAVQQNTRCQLACKVVDLRRLKPKAKIGRAEQPAAAEDIDNRVQIRKMKDLTDRCKREGKLEEKLKIYYREVEILASISHPNIIGLEKVFVTDNTIYIFQDLVTAGDLFSYIEAKNGKLLESEAAVITRQVLIALCFLHEKNIVHRDLKPDNILMTSMSVGCRVVLTDFGAARRIAHCRQRMTSIAGTDEYCAPEVNIDTLPIKAKNQKGYSMSVDMWSLGCITVILLTGGSPFIDPTTAQYSQRLANDCNLVALEQKSKDWQKVRPRPKHFVGRLLCLDEEHRMTAEQALNHEWFSNDLHKTNFEELYERTVKHWHPRLARNDMIQFNGADQLKTLIELDSSPTKPPVRRPPQKAVDMTMQPVPRGFMLNFWPKRKGGSPLETDEVKEAIQDHWSFASDAGQTDSATSNRASSPSLQSPRRPTDRDTVFPRPITPRKNPEASLAPADAKVLAANKSSACSSIFSPMPVPRDPDAKAQSRPNDAKPIRRPSTPRPAFATLTKTTVALRPAQPTVEACDPVKGYPVTSSTPTRSKFFNGTTSSSGGNQLTPTRVSADQRLEVSKTLTELDSIKVDASTGPVVDEYTVKTPVEKVMRSPPSRLKRLPSSPTLTLRSEHDSSHTPKRRRESIFDIEEDENGIDQEVSEIALKRQKRADLLAEHFFTTDFDENAADDTEITLPHNASALAMSRPHETRQELYLPR